MLDAFIIDELRRREREEERRRDEAFPRLEIPLAPSDLPYEPKEKEEKPSRGVIIVDYTID